MNLEIKSLFWAAFTLGVYAVSLGIYRRCKAWWASPMLFTFAFCALLVLLLRASYSEYLGGTGWLVTLLGPATVAFAVPIFENRALIRKHWVLLAAGTLVGSAVALASSWLLAQCFQLSPEIQASLLPRSITTPFAVMMSKDLGGAPQVTAALTAVTGIFGAAVGEVLLGALPLRTAFARGAAFGMGASGAGVAKARELGEEEGVVASLIMIFAGLLNFLGVLALGAL